MDSPMDDEAWEVAHRQRFQGRKEQWLRYTKPERDLAASLEQIEARDLATHLYNVHMLKAQEVQERGPRLSTLRKDLWPQVGRQVNTWVPRPLWTAWPLKPEVLPRSRVPLAEPSEFEDDNRKRKTPVSRERQDLQDALTAEVLRHARSTFESRENFTGSRPKRQRRARRKSSTEAETEDDTVQHSAEHSTPWSRFDPIIDEDNAADRAKPVVNHAIAQLEALLFALHQSQRSQYPRGEPRQTQSEPSSDSEPPASTTRKTPFYHEGMRDWSEVFGTAALLGWDRSMLERATARCERLFEERMEFATVQREEPDVETMVMKSIRGQDIVVQIKDFCCPDPDCKLAKKVFLERRDLIRHLQRAHGVPLEDIERIRLQLTAMDDGVLDGHLDFVRLKRRHVTKKRRAKKKTSQGPGARSKGPSDNPSRDALLSPGHSPDADGSASTGRASDDDSANTASGSDDDSASTASGSGSADHESDGGSTALSAQSEADTDSTGD